MKIILKIHLQKVAPLTVGIFKNLNEAENRIKEILKEGLYKTNEKSPIKIYYPLHRIEEFEVKEEK